MKPSNLFDLVPSENIQKRPYRHHPVTAEKFEKSVVKKRKTLVENLENSGTLILFEEVFEILKAPIYSALYELLKAPLCPNVYVPSEYRSDVKGVAVIDEMDGDEAAVGIQIPYVPWGQPWFEDNKGLPWSKDGLLCLQIKLFWRSLDELALSNNELEKWSVLRWIFRPTIWKHYIYKKEEGKSVCFPNHERDDPFSFHNCCIAARMLADVVRDGVRRNVSAEVIKAVDKVCTFD